MQKFLKQLVLSIVIIALVCAPVVAVAQASPADEGFFNSAIGKIGNVVSSIVEIPNSLMVSVGNSGLRAVGFFTWLSSEFLNQVIQFSIVEMKEQVTALSAIDIGWKGFRDIANLTFIFIIIFIAIGLILGNQSYNSRSVLVRLIIVALLINFSLFFTKVVIDSSNIFAMEFYKKTGIEDASNGDNGGFAGMVMGVTNIASVYSLEQGGGGSLAGVSGQDNVAGALVKPVEFFVLLIMGAVFLLILMFVFAAMGALLLMRFVVLIFLMVLSPLAFAAYILPATSGMTMKWWNMLIKNAFFAPALFILLWFVMNMVNSPGFKQLSGYTEGETFAQLILGDSFGIAMNFILVIVFLLAALQLANSMSIRGAGNAMSIGVKLGKFGRGLVARPAGAVAGTVGQATIGAAAGGLRKQYDKGVLGAGRAIDKYTPAPLKKVGGAVGRQLPTVKGIAQATAQATDRSIRTGLKSVSASGFGTTKPEDVKKDKKARKEEFAGLERKQEREQFITMWRDAVGAFEADKTSARETAKNTAQIGMEDTVRAMSNDELLGMSVDELKEIAPYLKDAQVDAIDKSKEKFNDAEKAGIMGARLKTLTEAIDKLASATTEDEKKEILRKGLEGRTDSDIARLSTVQLSNPDLIQNLKAKQVESLTKNKDLSPTLQSTIKDLRMKPLIDAIDAGYESIVKEILNNSAPKELVGLRDKLAEPIVARNINKRMFDSLKGNDDISAAVIEKIDALRPKPKKKKKDEDEEEEE